MAGVFGVTWVGVGAAGRGEGDPKLEADWWLRGLWYSEGSSCSTVAPAAVLCIGGTLQDIRLHNNIMTLPECMMPAHYSNPHSGS